MTVRTPLVLSGMIIAAMTVFAFLTEARLPDDAVLPIHFDAAGQPDDWAPALTALLLPVGVVAFAAALVAVLPFIEPLQHRLEASAPVLKVSWVGIVLLGVAIQAVIGLPAWGVSPSVNLVPLTVGLLLVALGNVLPKSRPSFFVGIRTPWAIMDTDNWIATHRLGGKLFMLAGAVIILASLLVRSAEPMAIIVMGSVLTAAIVPFVYSWWLWHRGRSVR